MKRLISGIVFVATALGAHATPVFTGSATLTGAQEVPPRASSGTGTARVTVDDKNDRDPNTNLFSWNVSFSDLTTTFNNAHFHGPAVPGQNAAIQVPITQSLIGTPGTSGQLIGSANITRSDLAQLEAGKWYVNVHSVRFPAGEIRGQVLPTSTSVPEPSTMSLLGLSLIAIARARRKSRSEQGA